MGSTWPQLGSQDGTKMGPKRGQKGYLCWMPSWTPKMTPKGPQNGPKMVPKWTQNWPQNVTKITPRWHQNLYNVYNHFTKQTSKIITFWACFASCFFAYSCFSVAASSLFPALFLTFSPQRRNERQRAKVRVKSICTLYIHTHRWIYINMYTRIYTYANCMVAWYWYLALVGDC